MRNHNRFTYIDHLLSCMFKSLLLIGVTAAPSLFSNCFTLHLRRFRELENEDNTTINESLQAALSKIMPGYDMRD